MITSLFDDGILLFNPKANAVTVELRMPAGRWDVDYPGLPGSITLPPLAIRWVERQGIPEEGLRKLRHELGGSFLVSRDKVQEELKLTREQKEKLEQHLQKLWPDASQFFQKIEGLKREEQEKELGPYRPKMREKLAALLKETLNEGQRTRLRQLELQKEGLRDGDIWNDLQVTDEQRRQFMALMQQALKEIDPLLEEAQKSGSPKKIQPKVIKIRDNLEATMEALLTDAQKTQWKEMLGKPMDHLDDLFDL